MQRYLNDSKIKMNNLELFLLDCNEKVLLLICVSVCESDSPMLLTRGVTYAFHTSIMQLETEKVGHDSSNHQTLGT